MTEKLADFFLNSLKPFFLSTSKFIGALVLLGLSAYFISTRILDGNPSGTASIFCALIILWFVTDIHAKNVLLKKRIGEILETKKDAIDNVIDRTDGKNSIRYEELHWLCFQVTTILVEEGLYRESTHNKEKTDNIQREIERQILEKSSSIYTTPQMKLHK